MLTSIRRAALSDIRDRLTLQQPEIDPSLIADTVPTEGKRSV